MYWLFNVTRPSGRLTRRETLLSEFDIDIMYKKGTDNHHSDALSRILNSSPTVEPIDDGITAFTLAGENDLDISSTIRADCFLVYYVEPEQ